MVRFLVLALAVAAPIGSSTAWAGDQSPAPPHMRLFRLFPAYLYALPPPLLIPPAAAAIDPLVAPSEKH